MRKRSFDAQITLALDHPDLVWISGGIAPEGVAVKLPDEIERQDCGTRFAFNAATDEMQAGRAEAAVEFGGIEFDVVEVMLEQRFSDEIVDGRHGIARSASHRSVSAADLSACSGTVMEEKSFWPAAA